MKKLAVNIWKKVPLSTKLQLFLMRRFNDKFLIGVTGIFFNDEDEILLVKHTYRDGDKWSLPGGYIKGKEHPREALEREVEEETGLTVSADHQLKTRTDRESARIDMTYFGSYIDGNFQESEEVSSVGFFNFEDLPLLPKDQLIFIEKAIEQRKRSIHDQKAVSKTGSVPKKVKNKNFTESFKSFFNRK